MAEISQPESFDALYQRACERKGSEQALKALLGQPKSEKQLRQLGDDRYLAEFSKKVFQSGFVWRVVENKWPAFEELFFGFDIDKILLMPDEMLERKAADPAIIRNYKKVRSIRDNALMIDTIRREHGGVGEFLANWSGEDIIGLWAYLKKHGERLGGNTGPYALRAMGKDTFLLSRDVEAWFRQRKLIDGGLTSKRSLDTIQQVFNQLQQQSGRSLQQLSQIIAFSTGDNHIV
ncbi:DNA-3-methyladenine glycosylase I [Lacimicrobium alkaliphilum]|uniref:3-methyladenine DNA glycosylase n=1 Tax=Lacimicrobium alkaliphilum TaxID=1526571 RepID=A0ABQ1RR07_9ALTE|nr:DNA-3-methyladenine glycosylase I [Lacimicrobium alkaliphilum]GGD76520.1 3-methyladenine DNA glycosylase [Lacimicrobium alkaliphilum]